MPRRSPATRRAFTLVELLVVIAIIAVLVGLLLPAIQKVREASARASCLNNLRQIAIGLANYDSQNGNLPPGRLDRTAGTQTVGTWAVYLLPFVEQQQLFTQYDLGKDSSLSYSEGANALNVTSKRVKVYTCPSDLPTSPIRGGTGATNVNITAHNYLANFGNSNVVGGNFTIGSVTTTFLQAPFYRTGLSSTATIRPRVARLGSDIADGTSNTLMISEAVQGQQYATTCSAPTANGGPCFDYRGVLWWGTGTFFTGYLGPNSTAGDQFQPNGNCDSLRANILNPPCTTSTTTNGGTIMGSRSRHSGGVQSAFCDGSARFVPNSILIQTWSALSSAQGGETFDPNF